VIVTSSRSAVLLSAGLDSAVLAAAEARRGNVHPIYVTAGLAWESEERAALGHLLAAPAYAGLAPLVRLSADAGDVYPSTHWAMTGTPPGYDTEDSDVYLAGRNVMLLGKTAVYCAQHAIGRIVIGPLAGNPFPDATPGFFAAMARALSIGLDWPIAIDAPFAERTKADVIRLGVALGVPFERTISCMKPRSALHCGRCSKCRERRDAFRDAGVTDPTEYVGSGFSRA
jgi:7-cyano-7-deazaguanine synthase